MDKTTKTALSLEKRKEQLGTLQARFEKHMNRHTDIPWEIVRERLEDHSEKLGSLIAMEISGGEPDVVGQDRHSGEYIFFDCSAESPEGRRSICYDREGLESRKANRPKNTAIDMAGEMGIELMTEEQYKTLQQFGTFDTKTSSWLKTPEDIRKLGGALFGDFRFGRAFIYHNGAQSSMLLGGLGVP